MDWNSATCTLMMYHCQPDTRGAQKGTLKSCVTRFLWYGILINPAKCVFGVKELHFLSHHINKNGVHIYTSGTGAGSSQLLPPIYPQL